CQAALICGQARIRLTAWDESQRLAAGSSPLCQPSPKRYTIHTKTITTRKRHPMNTSMPPQLRQLLNELYKQGKDNDASTRDRSHKMLNLEPDTAHFLSILVRGSRRTRILEIGTSNGYSTTWLAWATQPLGGPS